MSRNGRVERVSSQSPWRRLLKGGLAVVLGAGLGGACSDSTPMPNPNPDPNVVEPEPEPDPLPIPSSVRPPSIVGGTLALMANGRTAIASDPDRDQVHVIDLVERKVKASFNLNTGDEPGRIAEDGQGLAHVALRNGGALLSIDPAAGQIVARRTVCPAPRGLAFDASKGLLHVACATGELVSIAPRAEAPARTVFVKPDLRDVLVRGDKLLVSTFRSAEVLVVDGEGKLASEWKSHTRVANFQNFNKRSFEGGFGANTAAPSVAWRMVAGPKGQAVVIHQRAVEGEISTEPGGYANGPSCSGVVESTVSEIEPDPIEARPAVRSGKAMAGTVLPVDMAISPSGRQIAVVAAGQRPGAEQLQFFAMDAVTDEDTGTTGDVAPLPTKEPGQGCLPPSNVPMDDEVPMVPPPGDVLPEPVDYLPPNGEVTAVAFDLRGNVIVQTRQPSQIQILTQRAEPIVLSSEPRADAGHRVFHGATAGMVACASCHPDGGDDGRVWKFARIGARRTQSLRGGIMDTAPFHWDGDMSNMTHLVSDVFQGRMGGNPLTGNQIEALNGFIDAIPNLRTALLGQGDSASRGKALFHSATVGCATCHGGPDLTNNQSYDVGTGGVFQVPQLHGLKLRAPYMHNGCAQTLAQRFDPACGGANDRHGVVSNLSAAQISDLVAYLETL